jgi:hypothetical protein
MPGIVHYCPVGLSHLKRLANSITGVRKTAPWTPTVVFRIASQHRQHRGPWRIVDGNESDRSRDLLEVSFTDSPTSLVEIDAMPSLG